MQPSIDLLGLSLKTFGLCFGLAFVVSGAIVARRLKALGKPPDWAYEMVFAALVGGLVGARGYWLLGHTSQVGGHPLASIFGGSGLVWFGGALGGGAGVLGWAYRKGMSDRMRRGRGLAARSGGLRRAMVAGGAPAVAKAVGRGGGVHNVHMADVWDNTPAPLSMPEAPRAPPTHAVRQPVRLQPIAR